MFQQRFVARKAVEATWVETGVEAIDAAIRDTVDVAGLRTVFEDTSPDLCIERKEDGEHGCVASVSLAVTHNDGHLLSISSTTNLANANRTSYATTLITFAHEDEGWRRLTVADVLVDTDAFFTKHRCAVEADQGFALIDGAFNVYDATSFGRSRCEVPLEELRDQASCVLR